MVKQQTRRAGRRNIQNNDKAWSIFSMLLLLLCIPVPFGPWRVDHMLGNRLKVQYEQCY